MVHRKNVQGGLSQHSPSKAEDRHENPHQEGISLFETRLGPVVSEMSVMQCTNLLSNRSSIEQCKISPTYSQKGTNILFKMTIVNIILILCGNDSYRSVKYQKKLIMLSKSLPSYHYKDHNNFCHHHTAQLMPTVIHQAN